MTLLSLAQSILNETKNSSIPVSILGNTETAAVQVLQALTISITELSRSFAWQELQKEKTFSSVASQEGYDLPTDFDRFVDETFWNTSTLFPIEGKMNPQEWRILKNSVTSGASISEFFRIRGGQILLFPIPTAIQNYIYEYVSNLVVLSSAGIGQATWLADTDVPAIDSHLLRLDATWRLLSFQGRPYQEAQLTANLALTERVRVNGGRKTIRQNERLRNIKVGYPSIINAP